MPTKVAIIGATGYTGEELYRLLKNHPEVRITLVTSERQAGQPYLDSPLTLKSLQDCRPTEEAQILFSCLPHHKAMEAVKSWMKSQRKVIDLSADFRLRNVKDYARWYGPHTAPELLKEAVYGLPELYRKAIAKARLVANPGCYPTSVLLGLAPLMKRGWIRPGSLVIDAKSGISGAGREKVEAELGTKILDSMFPYNVGRRHRHTPEIEQGLSKLAKKKVVVTFIPQVIPIHRGMLTACHFQLKKKLTERDLHDLYQEDYAGEPFVQVLPPGAGQPGAGQPGALPEIRSVVMTNLCQIGFSQDNAPHTSIFTVIDNLTKGASGQAVQNMNLMCGFPETTGLL